MGKGEKLMSNESLMGWREFQLVKKGIIRRGLCFKFQAELEANI